MTTRALTFALQRRLMSTAQKKEPFDTNKFGKNSPPVVIFDGVCKWCNANVNFVIDKDKKKIFKFAQWQSRPGQELLKKFNIEPDVNKTATMILIGGGVAYSHSTAALKIGKKLEKPYSWIATAALFVPRPIRDFGYSLIARNRYRIMGKYNQCLMPSKDVKDRFLED
jgi:predicted DCC family thiol-disulfide oxidoreductase YuxK